MHRCIDVASRVLSRSRATVVLAAGLWLMVPFVAAAVDGGPHVGDPVPDLDGGAVDTAGTADTVVDTVETIEPDLVPLTDDPLSGVPDPVDEVVNGVTGTVTDVVTDLVEAPTSSSAGTVPTGSHESPVAPRATVAETGPRQSGGVVVGTDDPSVGGVVPASSDVASRIAPIGLVAAVGAGASAFAFPVALLALGALAAIAQHRLAPPDRRLHLVRVEDRQLPFR